MCIGESGVTFFFQIKVLLSEHGLKAGINFTGSFVQCATAD